MSNQERWLRVGLSMALIPWAAAVVAMIHGLWSLKKPSFDRGDLAARHIGSTSGLVIYHLMWCRLRRRMGGRGSAGRKALAGSAEELS